MSESPFDCFRRLAAEFREYESLIESIKRGHHKNGPRDDGIADRGASARVELPAVIERLAREAEAAVIDSTALWDLWSHLDHATESQWYEAWLVVKRLEAKPVVAENAGVGDGGVADEDEKWSHPDTPCRWAKQFGVSVDTIKRRFSDGTIRNKRLSDRSYMVDRRDLPTNG